MAQRTRQRSAPSREARLRADIARALGDAASELREWNTRLCPDCYQDVEKCPTCRVMGIAHQPPLYYALVCHEIAGDMPLGLGATADDALADLLWNLRAAALLDDLHSDR